VKSLSLKSQVLTFVLVTFAISWTLQYFMIGDAGVQKTTITFALMWIPGLAGMLFSLLFGWRLADIGFKFGNWRNYLWAYFLPAAISALILLALVGSGLGSFELSPELIEKKGGVEKALIAILLVGPFLGGLFGFISGLGEEIGWRGFLHSKIVATNVLHPFLLTGLVWAVWHWPLILFSNYATSDIPLLSVGLFTLMAVSLSVFMGWLREKSGSVFTAALAHGSHNLWIQGIYPAFHKKGPLDSYFGGESGVFCALFYSIIAVFIYWKCLRRGRYEAHI
jgi:uncharacterized protein